MKRLLLCLLLACSAAANAADTYYCADEDFDPPGDNINSGATAALPKTDGWCRANLSPGDTAIYAAGNYEGEDFVIDGENGTASQWITHRCATKHGCSFDKMFIDNSSYIEIIRMKSVSNWWDSTHSGSNYRVRMWGSHDITLTAVFLGGQRVDFYNDLVQIGDDSTGSGRASYDIVIRSSDTWGETQIRESTHTSIQFQDDDDEVACEELESGYALLGTPSTPLIVYTFYHHAMSVKGNCDVLVQHVDFQQNGTGIADPIPGAYSSDSQSGGTHHGSDHKHYAVRFNTYSYGGSGDSGDNNSAMWETGLFGSASPDCNGIDVAQDVCFAHNSMWRAWGNAAGIGRLNCILTEGSVDDIVYLNVAADETGYLETTEPATADRAANGYFLERISSNAISDVYMDGIVYDPVSALEGDLLMYHRNATTGYSDEDCSAAELGTSDIGCGSNITYDNQDYFTDPADRDFTIASGLSPDNLTAAAVPIAETTSTQTSATIPVTANRAQCFMGPIGESGYGYAGDVLDVGGVTCNVVDVDYDNDTVTCSEAISWVTGDDIYFVIDSAVMDDIGAVPSGAGPTPGPSTPGPPRQISTHLE